MGGKTRRHAGIDPVQRDPALVQPNDKVGERAPVGIGGGRLEALGAHGSREGFRQTEAFGHLAGMVNKTPRFQEPHEPNRSVGRQPRRRRGPLAVREPRALS